MSVKYCKGRHITGVVLDLFYFGTDAPECAVEMPSDLAASMPPELAHLVRCAVEVSLRPVWGRVVGHGLVIAVEPGSGQAMLSSGIVGIIATWPSPWKMP